MGSGLAAMEGMTVALDLDAIYSVSGWNGIAFYIYGYPKQWEAYISFDIDEETGEETELDTGEGEWVDGHEDNGRVIVVMVGDDTKREVDVSDLTEIEDTEYCHDCGQLGCGWNTGES